MKKGVASLPCPLSFRKPPPFSDGSLPSSVPSPKGYRQTELLCSQIRTVICECANIVRKPLSQAGRGMSFAARSARTSLMFTYQGKRKKGTNRITAKKCLRHSEYCGILNIKKDICANRCPTGVTDRRLAQHMLNKNSRLVCQTGAAISVSCYYPYR